MKNINRLINTFVFTAIFLLAQAAFALPQDGQEFKDWTAKCAKLNNGNLQCHIEQHVVTGSENKRILTLQIGYYKDRAIATFIAPLGVLLQKGVGLQIDKFTFSNRFPYTICEVAGCFASTALDESMIDMLKNGKKMLVNITDPSGNEIAVPVSLNGFTSAFDSLQ